MMEKNTRRGVHVRMRVLGLAGGFLMLAEGF
jgi:hypothetical protein